MDPKGEGWWASMLLEISLFLLVVAIVLRLLRKQFLAFRAQREERERRALAQRIDWRRPAQRPRKRRAAWQFWR